MQNTIIIDDLIQGAIYLNWREISVFQGDLKVQSQAQLDRLVLSLETEGFFDVAKVWHDKNDNINYFADGHQRKGVLTYLSTLGYKFVKKSNGEKTDLIPCAYINAENKTDLARKLLIINNQYATITSEGLSHFTELYGVKTDFMQSIVKFEQFTPPVIEQKNVWSAPEIQTPPFIMPQKPIKEIEYKADNGENNGSNSNNDNEKDSYTELNLILKNSDYKYIIDMIYRIKKDREIDSNAEALVYICEQYDMYCGKI